MRIFVDSILRGVKPGAMLIEQPARLELTVSMTAARAIGIRIPNLILVRTDRVIE